MKSRRNLYNRICRVFENVEMMCSEDFYEFPSDCTFVSRLTEADIRFIDDIMYELDVMCGSIDLPKVNPKRTYAIWVTANRNYGRQPSLYWSLKRITD